MILPTTTKQLKIKPETKRYKVVSNNIIKQKDFLENYIVNF